MYGVRGAITAGGLFVLPSFLLLCALSAIYVEYGEVAAVAGIVRGLGAAVIALVAAAVIRVGGRVIHTPAAFVLAGAAFGLIVADVPFPLIVALAAVVGYVGGSRRSGLLGKPAGHGREEEGLQDSPPETSLRRRFVKTLLLGSSLSPRSCSPAGWSRSLPASSRSRPSARSAALRGAPSSPAPPWNDSAGSPRTTWSRAWRWASRRRGR